MITVKEAMSTEVVCVDVKDDISVVAKTLNQKGISGLPVLDGDELVGIVTEGDIIKLLEFHSPKINLILPAPLDLIELPLKLKQELDNLTEGIKKAANIPLEDIMSKKVITIDPDSTIADVAEIMHKNNIKTLPVLEEGKLIGIISRKDIISAMVK